MLIACLLVAGIQRAGGAYSSDFSADDDEGSHAVSSLAVHDYVTRGFPQKPLPFAESFYLHYPKLAIGHWPPLFYVSEAGWMLAFGRSRQAMVAFTGICGAALVCLLFLWVRRAYGAFPAVVASLAMLAPGFVRTELLEVSPDILLALLTLCSAVALGRYLEDKQPRFAILFAVFSIAAIGVHGRGAMLLFLPFAAVLTRGRRWTVKQILGLILVAAVAITIPPLLHQSYRFHLGHSLMLAAQYPLYLVRSTGWGVAILAFLGLALTVGKTVRPAERSIIWGLALSGWAFYALVNAGFQAHYLITVAPAIAALAGIGVNSLARMFRSRVLRSAVAIGAAGALCGTAFPMERKNDLGYHALAPNTDRVDLIAGDAANEGAFIAEKALRDPAGTRFALRASKLLSSSAWNGASYRLRYSTARDVLACLDAARVETVYAQRGDVRPHMSQLLEALASGAWREVHPPGLPGQMRAFERPSPLPPGDPVFTLDLSTSLGRTLKTPP